MSHWYKFATHRDWIAAGCPNLSAAETSPDVSSFHGLAAKRPDLATLVLRGLATFQSSADRSAPTTNTEATMSSTTQPGKKYENLSNLERSALANEDWDVFQALRKDWIQRGRPDEGSRTPEQLKSIAYESLSGVQRLALANEDEDLFKKIRKDWYRRGCPSGSDDGPQAA